MSGPPYPPPPAPNSNAIGSFTIGVSPIGTIPAFNPWVSVLSQYATSPILTALITSFNAAIEMTENFDNFLSWVQNPPTAQGFGLDIIGEIVGVSRVIQLPSGTVQYFGFQEADSWTGFGQGPFFSGETISSNVSLSDSDFLTLIYAKMYGNISDGSITSINEILLTLFPGRGACYVQDNQNMSLTYVFEFALTPIEAAIITQKNVLPAPTGVVVSIQQS